MGEIICDDQGRLPFYHIEANSIPEAYYEALKVVHYQGHTFAGSSS